jgi:hypothetical protein
MFPFVFKVLIAPKTSGAILLRTASKKTNRIAITIIEIRPFRNGWTLFEAPRVEKSLLFPELGFAVSVEDQ